MGMIVFAALLIGSLGAESETVQKAVVCFIAGQAVLAYFAAGVAKCFGPMWRSGLAVGLIFSTEIYGTPSVGRILMRRAWLNKAACWSAVSFQLAFPLCMLDPRAAIAAAVIGAGFHATNAAIMGLNVFFWMFISAYPCIIVVSSMLRFAGR